MEKTDKALSTIRARFKYRIYPNAKIKTVPADAFCVSLMELTEPFSEGNYESGQTIRVAGVSIPSMACGDLTYEIMGEFEESPKYGKSLKAKLVCPIMPSELSGIKAVLSSGIVPGIGPKTAEKIVDFFGKDTLRIIESEPIRLLEMRGISERLINRIRDANFSLSRELQEAVIFLQSHGVPTKTALRIGNHFRDKTEEVLTQNPYRATEVEGVGFVRADAIAKSMGLQDPLDLRRVEAAIHQALLDIYPEGHMCYSQTATRIKALNVLGVAGNAINAETVNAGMDAMIHDRKIVVHEYEQKTFLYLPSSFFAETSTAMSLAALARSRASVEVGSVRIERIVKDACRDLRICLDKTQEEAVVNSLWKKVSIITGGPGTGKTTILKAMVAAYKKIESKEVHLMAPTGRAARRMCESTGERASTIHSALGLTPVEEVGKKCSVELDGLVVVDEVSMVDGFLMSALAKSLAPTARLVLIGDVDQLPSVGPGAVLKNLIGSGVIPVTRLVKTFRQKGGSVIIANTSRINRGDDQLEEVPGEFLIRHCAEKEQQEEAIRAYLYGVKKYGLSETALLTPFRRHGDLACNTLNPRIQGILNPPDGKKAEIQIHHGKPEDGALPLLFRVGDPVIASMNFLGKDISNGDIGIIEKIEERAMVVRFDAERAYEISGESLFSFDLAYAMTIHKSQGSEYACVVLVCSSAHKRMIKRNLIYTGLSRSKKEVITVTDPPGPPGSGALYLAANTPDTSKRGTFLSHFLRMYH